MVGWHSWSLNVRNPVVGIDRLQDMIGVRKDKFCGLICRRQQLGIANFDLDIPLSLVDERGQKPSGVETRSDPRDLSRIWVLDPERNTYIEVPVCTLSNPPITKWEHRAALSRVREQGREQIDEAAIFKAVDQMRGIVDTATKETRAQQVAPLAFACRTREDGSATTRRNAYRG